MNINEWGTLFIYWLIAIAFIGGLATNISEMVGFKKIQSKVTNLIKLHPLAFAGITTFLIIATTFFTTVQFSEGGNIAYFGQTGDFFGGILNPTLGFVSVILLLSTLKTAQEDQRRQSKKTDRENLTIMIDEFSRLLVEEQNNQTNYRRILGHSRSLSMLKLNDDLAKKSKDRMRGIIDMFSKRSLHSIENEDWKIMVSRLLEVRSKIENICELYVTLIDEEQAPILNKFSILKMEDFLNAQVEMGLLSIDEYHLHLNKISEKYKHVFYRRHPTIVHAIGIVSGSTVGTQNVGNSETPADATKNPA